MEKILVLSDSHGNSDFLNLVLEQENHVDTIFHLGDNFDDLDKCGQFTKEHIILKVPGIFHPGYKNRSIPAIQFYNTLNWKLLLVHDLNDALSKAEEADIYLYGHTHKPDLQIKYGKIFFNPGHLKQSKDRGSKASYGILELEEESVKFIVKDLNKNVIFYKLVEK
jgi:uncharacterized protein